MSELNPPPLPGKKAMIAMAGALALLFGLLVFIVLALFLRPTPEEKELQLMAQEQQSQPTSALDKYKQDTTTEQQFEKNQQQTVEDIKDTVSNGKYEKQLVRRTENAVDESQYLSMRRWGFWHIVFPFFIAVVIFIIWVKNKHKKWIN